jgi:oligopeptide/dipeptide ABC transporter ATP-binding protein
MSPGAERDGVRTVVSRTHVLDAVSVAVGGTPVLDDISLAFDLGKIYGLVGESGSGKTMIARALAGILPDDARLLRGAVRVAGVVVSDAHHTRPTPFVSMVVQDPQTALNPVLRVGAQVAEAVRLHQRTSGTATARVVEKLLADVGLASEPSLLRKFPHELSGGACQRFVFAAALATRPSLLITDEPTNALDAVHRGHILHLLRKLASEQGIAILFVTHDLSGLGEICDDVSLVYSGRIVEQSDVSSFLRAPRHPYARALLAATPSRRTNGQILSTLEGVMPSAALAIDGCRFRARCPRADTKCAWASPVLEQVAGGVVACHYPVSR